MGTMISSGSDVVAFLKEQHQEIKALFQSVASASGEDKENLFAQLRRLLAVHETAEEEIVHPAARKALVDGEDVVNARLREEHDAKEVLRELESLDVNSTEFGAKFQSFAAAVVAHAEAEETEEFERLPGHLDADRLERMRSAAEFAESVAPTHPHPGVESRAANLLAGPFAAMVDRTRDAFAGRN
jgi:hemerythrin superfamily protein